MDNTGHLLTIRDVADRLGVSERTIRRKIRQRELRTVKLGQGEKAPVRIEVEELARFIAKAHDRALFQRMRWAIDDRKLETPTERSAA